jgi:integral membrane protein (TIGR01906 family)
MSKHKTHSNAQRNIIIILFALTLFIIIIFGSLNMMIFNKDLYYKEYSKNGVYLELSDDKNTGEQIAQNVTENMMKYFRNTEKLNYFTETEKSHMADVKHLIRTMQFIYYGAAILSIGLFFYAYRKYKEDKYMFIRILAKSLLYSSIIAGGFLIILFLLSVFSFDFLFATFHIIFFPQGKWMFDSSSMLITMFPQQFFFDISLRIFVYAIFQAIIFFGMGYWMNKQLKIYEKHHLFDLEK